MADRLDVLLDDMVDGVLSPEASQELQVALTDPQALARARRYWRIHQRLPLLMREEQGDRFVEALSRELQGSSGSFVRHQRHRRQRVRRSRSPSTASSSKRWGIAGTALAALAAALVVFLHLRPQPIEGPPGTVVVGSALTPLADGSWFLSQGRSELTVQPQSIGLRVRTPHILATVHGTVFSIIAEADESQVVVTHGVVEVTAGTDTILLPAGGKVSGDQRGLLRTVIAHWRPGEGAGWQGIPVANGLRTTTNPLDAGSGLVQSPVFTDPASPLMDARQILEIRYVSLAAQPQTLAGMMVGRPQTGSGQAWLCERTIAPGPGVIRLPISEFAPRDAQNQPLAGQHLDLLAAVCWGAGIEAVVIEDITLVTDFR